MKKKRICGIYCIENMINHKKYIGQSTDISKRWVYHKNSLNGNYHINTYLQNAWNKYGANNFKFYILEECEEDKNILNEKEQYWIDNFDSFNNGYNLTLGGDNTSESLKKEVVQYDKEQNVLAIYKSLQEASDMTGVKTTGISMCCCKNAYTAGGYLWSFVGEKPLEKPRNFNHTSQKINVYTIDGKFIEEFETIIEASEKYDVNRCSIRRCCKGKMRYVKGFVFRYQGDSFDKYDANRQSKIIEMTSKPVDKFDLNHNYICTYSSLTNAKNDCNGDISSISKCCNHQYGAKTHKGFIWEWHIA